MLKAFVQAGHEVIACAPNDNADVILESELQEMGVKYINLKIERTGTNPFKDLMYFFELKKIIKSTKPDVFLSYTIKPNIYGSLAANYAGVTNIYSMMTGAGSILRSNSWKNTLLNIVILPLYRFAFDKNKKIFFLNEDDMNFFLSKRIINYKQQVILGSSGVNLDYFEKSLNKSSMNFLFVGRLIKDKGIMEFLKAAKLAKEINPNLRFQILGPFDSNPSAISKEELKGWCEKGIVEYLGEAKDVRPYMNDAFAIVLPSYHEGQGRVLIEAMAMGKLAIATDVPGCRQTINHNVDGFLVEVKNSEALANQMISAFDDLEKSQMIAENGYLKVKNQFDVNIVNTILMKNMDL